MTPMTMSSWVGEPARWERTVVHWIVMYIDAPVPSTARTASMGFSFVRDHFLLVGKSR